MPAYDVKSFVETTQILEKFSESFLTSDHYVNFVWYLSKGQIDGVSMEENITKTGRGEKVIMWLWGG